MNRLDGGGLNEDIEANRININDRLEKMRTSVIPSFWYSFFKSSWLIAMVVALILIFSSGTEGLLAGGDIPPIRIAAIVLIGYAICADLIFAPLVKRNFLKKHPNYKTSSASFKKNSKEKPSQQITSSYVKQSKKMSKAQKARLGTAAQREGK